MRACEQTIGRLVGGARRAIAILIVCVTLSATSLVALAQGTPPRINPIEASKIGTLPYNADIESRLTFISGLYRQMPRLFEESAKYDFDMLQILTDQGTLLSRLNETPEYRNALQNRPPLSQVTVVPLGNQGNRTRVPVRGELPTEAIEEFQERLIAAAEAVDAELVRTKGTWSANAITEVIRADLARLDPSKPNPGQIVAALQSLLSPSERKEAGAIKDFSAKIDYLALHVDPDKVKDPALFDPARLRLSTVFSKTPTLEELLTYSTEYTKVKEGLGDRLALYAELNATPGSEASKAALLENLRKLNKDQLVYLSDEADILRPIFEKISPDATVRGSLIKNVTSTLGEVFDRAPTSFIELSPVLLAEQPWWYGILRGFVSGDCSSQHSFAYPNDPGERTFFVSDPGSPGDYKGIVTASSVVKGGKRSLYVITIHGSRISPADVYSILYGLDQIKGQLGYDAIELPTSENLHGLVNREDLRLAMDSIASRGALGEITYENDTIRAAIEGLESDYNKAHYDSRARNSRSRSFVPDPQVIKGLNAANAWGTLQTVDTSLPSKATAIQMFHDLLYAKRVFGFEAQEELRAEMGKVAKKWGLNIDDVVDLMNVAKNRNQFPLKTFELDLNQRLTKLLDAPSPLPRGTDTAQSLLDSRMDWFREGYSRTPDLLKPENAAAAAKVLKSFVADLKVALKESKVPAYLFNNRELIIAEPILSAIARDGIWQGTLIGRGQDLLAQSYRTLLTGKAQDFASNGKRISDAILGYRDHRGDSVASWTKTPPAPLSEGPVRSAVVDILNRYEIGLMQRTGSITWLEKDIKTNGRNDAFWKQFREAVRTWDTADIPEGVRPKILETAVFKFGPLFDPNFIDLLPTVHGASAGGPNSVANFLTRLEKFPPALLEWYVKGFLADPSKFPVWALNNAEVPASVWNKVQTLPFSVTSSFLSHQLNWPQATREWFFSQFTVPEVIDTMHWEPPEWKLLSELYDRGQVPEVVIDGIVRYISRHPTLVLDSFSWNWVMVPQKIQAAILQEAFYRPTEASLKAAAKHLSEIPQSLYDKTFDYLTKAPSKELGWAAVEFLRDTALRWPESVRLKVISAAYNPSAGGWLTDGNLGKLLGQLSGDKMIVELQQQSLANFATLLDMALEKPPGKLVERVWSDVMESSERVRVNLNAATFKALLMGQLGVVPDAFAVLAPEEGAKLRSGITLDIQVYSEYLRHEANGARVLSAADLILSVLQDRVRKIGWSVDPRIPASVGDMAVLSQNEGLWFDRDTGGGAILEELRKVVQDNLKPPTTPGEVVVRGGANFTKAVTDAVTRHGGEVYTGEGGRTRVVASDGSVIEFPTLESRDYVKVIGDRVAFIEVVGGTATGAAATSLANQVPADVQAEFNKINPVAGNEFVEEGVNQVIDRMAEAGKPATIGGLPIEGITDGQLAVGKRSSFENIRDAYYDAGWEANLKAHEMINSVTKWRQGFGVAGMIGSFVMLETANSVFDQQINAIAAGNWDAFDSSYRDSINKLPETALHTAAGIAVFEGAGIGFGALSTAGATLTAGGSTGLGAAASGAGAAGTMALTATGVAFVAAAVAVEINEMGKTATLMDQLDAQAAQVGMTDDSWAYSDNALYRQWQLEAELGTHVVGGAWNSVVDSIKETFNEMVMKGLGSPDGKIWAFDGSFENGDIGVDSSKPNPFPPSEAAHDWIEASAQAGNGADAAPDEPMIKIPSWLEDLAQKGSLAGKALSGILHTVHDVFPSFVGSPTSRGADVLKAAAQKPPTATENSRLAGTNERMEDAIRRMNQKEGTTTPPTNDIRFDDLVAELGTDPVAWSEAFEAGLISMADIERVFGRMKGAEPEDPNAPPPPQIVKAPASAVVEKGKSVTLTVQATGQNLHFVWARNGEPFVNLDGATLTISNADFDDAGSYVAYVSDGKTMVAAPPAQVSVVGFTVQPPSASSVAAGKALSLSAQLSVGNATYQWMKNGAALTGATNPTLTVPSIKSSDAGLYTVVARVGGITVTSDTSAVNVMEFSKEPEFRVAAVGSRVTIPASAKVTLANGASATVTYQWFKGGVAMTSQTAAVLTITSAQKSDTSKYAVRIVHGDTSIESASAHLEVIDRVQSAVSLTTSPAYTCSIPQTTGGKVSCSQTVGTNTWGEATPGNILGATSLGLGVRHGCAINALSKVVCWGDNAAGQTKPPADLTGVVSLGMGPTYSCALLNTGSLRCWGGAVTAPGVNQVIALESSASGTCVKTLAGDRMCWGP